MKQNWNKNKTKLFLIIAILTFNFADIFAQQSIALPGNANYSNQTSPQGGLRYQRAFYLIKPQEIKKAGFLNNTILNGIGFTLTSAQNINTKGAFKLYLKNTNDTVSITDTNWVSVSTNNSSLIIPSGLFPGEYDWCVSVEQDNVNLSYASINSDTIHFDNSNLDKCQKPTHLTMSNVSTSSARFNWEAPLCNVSNYSLEYKVNDTSSIWSVISTPNTNINVSGLSPDTYYSWRLKTVCSITEKSSFISGTVFKTDFVKSCPDSVPTLLNAVARDTSVRLSWNGRVTADNYEVLFRRLGTMDWVSYLTNVDTALIKFYLVPGATYEWKVRTNCSNYTIGSNFSTTTTGLRISFPPLNLTTNSLTDSSVILKWDGVAGIRYKVKYRVLNTIKWDNAINGMNTVCNDSITLPNSIGKYNIGFTGNNTFTYSGGGIYVAWEYNQSNQPLSTFNTSLSTSSGIILKDDNGLLAGRKNLSFAGINNLNSISNSIQSRLTAIDYRPETSFSSVSFNDSVEVVDVYTLGKAIPKLQSPLSVTALVANKSRKNKQYSVMLTVKQEGSGELKYTESKNISVAAGDTNLVTFNNWNPKFLEKDSIIISIPQDGNETVLNNNIKTYIQELNPTVTSYADDNLPAFSVGAKTSSGGLLLNRHHLNDSAKVFAAQIYLTDDAVGHSFYAVVCDSNRNIVGQSPSFIAQKKDVNQYVYFHFPSPVSFNNSDFYIGLAQSASANKYLPLGSQWEGFKPRSKAYYMANLNGLGFVDSPLLGRLMIKAQVLSSTQDCYIDGKTKLCSGGNLTLTAGKKEMRYANRVIAYSSQYDNDGNNDFGANQILGSPDVYPKAYFAPGAWRSQSADNRNEFIELNFPEADSINFVDIYEIQNAGAVDSIFTKNPVTSNYELKWHWNGDTSVAEVARKNHIKLDSMISYPVSQIKITLRSDTAKGGVAGYNTIDAVAIGKEEIPANFDTYLWMPGGETSQSINVSSPGTYLLNTTDANGHQSIDSIEVSVVTLAIPKIFVLDTLRFPLPNDTFCFGDSIRLVSDKARGNLWSTQETSKYITVKNTASITLINTDENGCNSNSSISFVVTVKQLPVPTIGSTNGGRLCPGKSVTLTLAAPSSCKDFHWSNGATLNTAAIYIPGNYIVTVKDTITGCSGTSSPIVLRAVSNPQPVISGVLRFCPNDSTILSVGSFSSYLWSNGSTNSTGVIKNAGGVTVTVTNNDGCKASANTIVSLLPKPTPSIVGKAKICPGESITITEGNGNYVNYLWTPGNYSTSSIQINQTGTYNVKVTDQNGCKADVNKIFSQAPVPTPVITSNVQANPASGVNRVFAFCPTTSLSLFAGVGYESYVWSSYSNNNSIRLGSGSSILTGSSSTYIVAVTNDFGCIGTDTIKTVASGFAPPSPITITGTSLVTCNAVQYTYSIPSISNAEYYIWKVPNGVTIVSGQGTTSINVIYGTSFKLGAIQVEAANRCGISPGRTATSLAVTALSNKPGSITGKSTGVCSAITETYSVPVSARATSYAWTAPTGATIATGQGTRTITLSFNTRFITGTLSVISVNSCGSSEATSLLISGYSQKPGTISGPWNVCSYQTNLIYNISPVPGATSYQWFVPSTAGIISGQGTTSIAMRMGTKDGWVRVLAISSCGKSWILRSKFTSISLQSLPLI